jgi:uncharacterized protein YeaO (DUF488 family)
LLDCNEKQGSKEDTNMAGQLIPPPGQEPLLPPGLTKTQRIALWADLVDATEELVKAGLRHKLGPDGDVDKAFKEWYDREMQEHDRTVAHMLEELRQRSREHAG